MSNIMTKSLLGLGLLAAAPLYADTNWDGPASKIVRYTELDLARPAGDQMLYQRIAAAAREVCRGLEGRELVKIKPHRDCLDSAVGRAVAQVNHPAFTAYYAAHNPGKSLPPVSVLPKQNGPLVVSKR